MWQHFFRPVVEQELIGSSKSFSPDKLSALSKWQLKEEKNREKIGEGKTGKWELGKGKPKTIARVICALIC